MEILKTIGILFIMIPVLAGVFMIDIVFRIFGGKQMKTQITHTSKEKIEEDKNKDDMIRVECLNPVCYSSFLVKTTVIEEDQKLKCPFCGSNI